MENVNLDNEISFTKIMELCIENSYNFNEFLKFIGLIDKPNMEETLPNNKWFLFLKSNKIKNSLLTGNAFEDTKQLFKGFDNFDKEISLLNNMDYVENLRNLTFGVGRKLWVEIEITDDLMSGMLMKHLYSKSEKSRNQLEAMGYRINSINFNNSPFNDHENSIILEATKLLTEKLSNPNYNQNINDVKNENEN